MANLLVRVLHGIEKSGHGGRPGFRKSVSGPLTNSQVLAPQGLRPILQGLATASFAGLADPWIGILRPVFRTAIRVVCVGGTLTAAEKAQPQAEDESIFH